MATNKNITMKQFNGTDYDTLYPKTIASQVDGVYNKQEVIKDATKTMFGYGSSAIPDTIFQWLGKYNQHWWKRRAVVEHTEEVRTEKTAPTTITHASNKTTTRTIQYADEIAFNSSNVPYLVNPISVDVSWSNYNSTLNNILGKYVKNIYNNSTTVYFVPSATSFSDDFDSSEPYYETFFASTIYSITGTTVTDKGSWNYIYSSNRNAYPDSGIVDNYEYKYLGIPFNNAVNAVKIETGSYMGTGTYGSSNPCSLTFDFSPILVYIVRKDISGNGYVDAMAKFYSICMDETYPGNSNNSNYYYQSVSANGGEAKLANNTLTWYASKAVNQMNALDSRYEYRYVAIGL